MPDELTKREFSPDESQPEPTEVDEEALASLWRNAPLTPQDLTELERILVASGVATPDHLQQAKSESSGLGLFVRSLVGLHREAAKQAFAGFLSGRTLTASQIEFIDLIVNHLTEQGATDPSLLYTAPFTDIAPQGPEAIFPSAQVDELVSVLSDIRARAAA